MPPDPALIRDLEAVADRAWPPAEVARHDGWELRATGPGIGRRVNSAAPLDDGALPLTNKVAVVEAFYAKRGLVPIIKLTTASRPEGLEAFLTARGYRLDAPVLILTRSLDSPGTASPGPANRTGSAERLPRSRAPVSRFDSARIPGCE